MKIKHSFLSDFHIYYKPMLSDGMKPYVEKTKNNSKRLKYIDELMHEVFSNHSQCRNCGIWNYTSDNEDENSGWTYCKCGHVYYVENQITWH
jgi:hypothetical protein